MKRKSAMMLAMILSSGLMLSTVVQATETGGSISGNEAEISVEVSEEPEESEETEEAADSSEDDEVSQESEQNDEEAEVMLPAGGEPESEPEPEDIEEEEVKKVSGGGALAVDGYYDDWEGLPETMISYGSHNTGGTVFEYHGGTILVSGGYVYVHIRMSDYYQQQIPVDDLKLTINGIEKSFIIRKCTSARSVDWDPSIYELSPGIHSDLGIFFRDGASVALGEAAVTISEASPNDSFEFRMKISDLEPIYGLEPGTIENGAKLEFFSPNIGPEKITVVGSSTGTYIGIALGFAVVLSALLGRKRKQGLS